MRPDWPFFQQTNCGAGEGDANPLLPTLPPSKHCDGEMLTHPYPSFHRHCSSQTLPQTLHYTYWPTLPTNTTDTDPLLPLFPQTLRQTDNAAGRHYSRHTLQQTHYRHCSRQTLQQTHITADTLQTLQQADITADTHYSRHTTDTAAGRHYSRHTTDTAAGRHYSRHTTDTDPLLTLSSQTLQQQTDTTLTHSCHRQTLHQTDIDPLSRQRKWGRKTRTYSSPSLPTNKGADRPYSHWPIVRVIVWLWVGQQDVKFVCADVQLCVPIIQKLQVEHHHQRPRVALDAIKLREKMLLRPEGGVLVDQVHLRLCLRSKTKSNQCGVKNTFSKKVGEAVKDSLDVRQNSTSAQMAKMAQWLLKRACGHSAAKQDTQTSDFTSALKHCYNRVFSFPWYWILYLPNLKDHFPRQHINLNLVQEQFQVLRKWAFSLHHQLFHSPSFSSNPPSVVYLLTITIKFPKFSKTLVNFPQTFQAWKRAPQFSQTSPNV